MSERTQQLLRELKTWCEQERGRKTQAAKVLGVSQSTLSDWFSERKRMNAEQALALQEFLRSVYGKKQ
jgi:predicted XRE-type DNA-binding protein